MHCSDSRVLRLSGYAERRRKAGRAIRSLRAIAISTTSAAIPRLSPFWASRKPSGSATGQRSEDEARRSKRLSPCPVSLVRRVSLSPPPLLHPGLLGDVRLAQPRACRHVQVVPPDPARPVRVEVECRAIERQRGAPIEPGGVHHRSH